MSVEYTHIFGEVVERVAERLNVSLPSRFRLLPEPEEMLNAIADSVEFEFADWERVYELAVEDCAKWQAKYIQCRDERNRLFQILKLALMDGVITREGVFVLSEMMDSSSGLDVSNAAKHSPES